MDGREVCMLNPGEYVTVNRSAYSIPCVTRPDGGDDWVADIKWVGWVADSLSWWRVRD
jgi:NAD kinase